VSVSECEFAVLGAGAIGSIIGAHLARAGHSVVMLARGARAAYLQEHGITLRGLSEFTIQVPTLTEPRELTRAGTLIVATKTPGTRAALAPLALLPLQSVLSIQNGPSKDELLTQAFGRERVIGALADTSGELLADGAVLFTRNVNVYVGELDGSDSARVRQLAQALDGAGVRATMSREILTLEWSKFCAWVGLTSLAVTTRALTWRLLSDPDSALLLVRLMRETGALAGRLGIALSDQAILPIATICAGSEQQAVALIMRTGADYRLSAAAHRMSALQDVEAGRPLEVNETLGYACDKAREQQLELPLLATFHALIAAIDRTRRGAAAS
jgi:2-dehydropantoate 2-reductase